ncbi:MAG: SHOCT domain-containing protein [Desulfitobacteriaceae bacterium]|nr:SHOCT domain-containing protein [Desulfitobacteriaceae bacterium]MDI6912675.1 SHOCT domain-containing protein [Desulfitobacteriaceae bacterium]
MMGWGNMWGYGGYSGYGNGLLGNGNYWWMGLIGMALQLAFWIALIVIGVKLFRNYSSRTTVGHYTRDNNPLDILRERYARGEIDAEEYQRRKNDLQ